MRLYRGRRPTQDQMEAVTTKVSTLSFEKLKQDFKLKTVPEEDALKKLMKDVETSEAYIKKRNAAIEEELKRALEGDKKKEEPPKAPQKEEKKVEDEEEYDEGEEEEEEMEDEEEERPPS